MRTERLDDLAAEGTEAILTVCYSAELGLGVRLSTDAAAGDILDRFEGTVGPELSQHSLQVAPGLYIGGTRYVGFLSHGCEPNCRLDMVRRELVALRPIRAGEWLTIDYAATEDELFRQFACRCGAAACRGWITGRKDPVSAEGITRLAHSARIDRAA
jgi:hypothetical protein